VLLCLYGSFFVDSISIITKITIIMLLYILITSIFPVFSHYHNEDPERTFSRELKIQIERIHQGEPSVILYNPWLINHIYDTDSEFIRPKWDNLLKIEQLVASIRDAYYHGLRPDDYHLSDIVNLTNEVIASANIDDRARLELLLTDSFLLLSAHLAAGKTFSDTLPPRWRVMDIEPEKDWKGFLEITLAESQITKAIEQLAPAHPGYTGLKEVLHKYREIEITGGWEELDPGLPLLKPGMRHPGVVKLRDRLSATGQHIEHDTADITLFDENLHQQVLTFQKRNGLATDGIVGPATIGALNVPVEEKVRLIKANLDRWRRFRPSGDHYIKINIPDFELEVIREGRTVLTHKIIAGTPDTQTPVISSAVTELEFNPYWYIPPGMLTREIIPAIRRNINYLAMNDMEIIGPNWQRVDPESVDWDSGFGDGFPYIIRQKPGPLNEMGRVKFIFPNSHFVTIHGTPHYRVFQSGERAFSNGCIRIRSPLSLARYLMSDQKGWTLEDIMEIIRSERNLRVKIDDPFPIHILYLTAWTAEDGLVHFRPDIYNYDHHLITALEQSPPISIFSLEKF
jgi:L,D-transpeptidase YcbB